MSHVRLSVALAQWLRTWRGVGGACVCDASSRTVAHAIRGSQLGLQTRSLFPRIPRGTLADIILTVCTCIAGASVFFFFYSFFPGVSLHGCASDMPCRRAIAADRWTIVPEQQNRCSRGARGSGSCSYPSIQSTCARTQLRARRCAPAGTRQQAGYDAHSQTPPSADWTRPSADTAHSRTRLSCLTHPRRAGRPPIIGGCASAFARIASASQRALPAAPWCAHALPPRWADTPVTTTAHCPSTLRALQRRSAARPSAYGDPLASAVPTRRP